jgi:3-methyladenine DNA glycosylase AlkD
MTLAEATAALESMGTEQNRRVYPRHGVGENQYGVSYADLGKLARRIKRDHALALELWNTGNHDARVLACSIADPAQLSAKNLDAWVRQIANYPLADAFTALVFASPAAKTRMEAWLKARHEYPSTVAWNLVARFAAGDDLPDSFYSDRVKAVEQGVAKAKNRTRYAMNMALISIGLRNAALEKLVLAAAGRIGPIEVDHGETGCRTPDVAAYIAKTKAHRASKR